MIHEFKSGDMVVATGQIRRKDFRWTMEIGDTATVRSVCRTRPESPQIIDIQRRDGELMTDIVCLGTVPLRIVSNNAAG